MDVTRAELQALRKGAARSAKLSISRPAKRKGNQGSPNYTNLMPRMTDSRLANYIRGMRPDISTYGLRLAIKRVNREFDANGTADIKSIVRDIVANS